MGNLLKNAPRESPVDLRSTSTPRAVQGETPYKPPTGSLKIHKGRKQNPGRDLGVAGTFEMGAATHVPA